ncbi:MAG: gamma-glutamyl-gamma-aminobutyrate hydrolase family protein [Thermomicrobiales bacterium]
MRPIIGITASPLREEPPSGSTERVAVPRNYVDAVIAAGGIPVILPAQDENNEAILSIVDGLLFTGGADIRPQVYGEDDVHPATYGIDDLRDRFELTLLNDAVAQEVPFFCVCRGIQVMNVALGGTLIQDIADQLAPEIDHHQHRIGIAATEPSHSVTAAPGSLIEEIYGNNVIATNSFHHQALKTVAAGLQVEARSLDGVVEAVSLPGHPFALGVQWHPEMMFRSNRDQLAPFTMLISKAAERKFALAQV